MICVTHEMGFARGVASRVVFMNDGEILEQAPPSEFFSAPKNERGQGVREQNPALGGPRIEAFDVARGPAGPLEAWQAARRPGGPRHRRHGCDSPQARSSSTAKRSTLDTTGRPRPGAGVRCGSRSFPRRAFRYHHRGAYAWNAHRLLGRVGARRGAASDAGASREPPRAGASRWLPPWSCGYCGRAADFFVEPRPGNPAARPGAVRLVGRPPRAAFVHGPHGQVDRRGLIAMTLNTGAYQSEIFRAGILRGPARQLGGGAGLWLHEAAAPCATSSSPKRFGSSRRRSRTSSSRSSSGSLLFLIGVAEVTSVSRSLSNFNPRIFGGLPHHDCALSLGHSAALADGGDLLERRLRIPGLGLSLPPRDGRNGFHRARAIRPKVNDPAFEWLRGGRRLWSTLVFSVFARLPPRPATLLCVRTSLHDGAGASGSSNNCPARRGKYSCQSQPGPKPPSSRKRRGRPARREICQARSRRCANLLAPRVDGGGIPREDPARGSARPTWVPVVVATARTCPLSAPRTPITAVQSTRDHPCRYLRRRSWRCGRGEDDFPNRGSTGSREPGVSCRCLLSRGRPVIRQGRLLTPPRAREVTLRHLEKLQVPDFFLLTLPYGPVVCAKPMASSPSSTA